VRYVLIAENRFKLKGRTLNSTPVGILQLDPSQNAAEEKLEDTLRV
jgi:hypothetical protein